MKPVHVSITYEQSADCTTGDDQYITISTEDGGAGPFLVIKTERWAIDPKEIDDFADELREVLRLAQP